jgi:hypothetical protein
MGEKRNAYRLFFRMLKGKRPLGRPRHMLVDNVNMYLGEICWDGMAQDMDKLRAFVKALVILLVP